MKCVNVEGGGQTHYQSSITTNGRNGGGKRIKTPRC